LIVQSFVKYVSFFISISILSGLSACATYHPKPLDEHAVSERLKPPVMESVIIRAKEFRHPILKPRSIDFERGISAQDAAIIAVIANPALLAERDRRGIAKAQLLQAGILPNPTFSYSLDIPTGGNTDGTVNAYGLGLDWDIKALLTRGAQVEAARSQAASVDLEVAWNEWQVAESAKQHVYRFLYLEKQLAVARQEEEGLEKNLEAVRKAVGMGDMTVIDLDAVDAAFRKIRTVVLDVEQRLHQERLALNRVLGFPPESIIRLVKDTELPSFENLPTVGEIMDGLESRRLDLLALRQGYQSQEARLRAAVRAQFPGINIGLSRARDTGDVITTGFSISISLPFFDRNQGQIAIEKADRRKLHDEYLNRVYQARADAAGILADINSVEKQTDAAKKAVDVLERLTQTSYRGFLEGNVDVLSYYNELDRLFSRRLEVLQLEQDLADLHIALEITAGEILGSAGNEKEVPR
jgi:outer membrane protein, heavy metal efflux system